MNLIIAACALLLERFVGYPKILHKTIGHPVEWLGKMIGALDRSLNRRGAPATEGRIRGTICIVVLLLATLAVTWNLHHLVRMLPNGWLVEVLLAVPLLAQKSLHDHVIAVADALDHSVESGRKAVAKIVGRDPADLDESGVARAALESLAENTSDGIVAPALWLVIGGLPGIALYKAINTADSMIGHKSERYLHFGWASAKLDDLVNLPASRLSGFLFAMAAWFSGRTKEAFIAMNRDAQHHVSPNAGWPEAALAGALGIQLGGPRFYDGTKVELAVMGEGRAILTRADIRNGLVLYSRTLTLLLGLTVAVAAIL